VAPCSGCGIVHAALPVKGRSPGLHRPLARAL